jgi:hypothetical protein
MSRYAARPLPKSLVDGLYLAFGLRGRAMLGLCWGSVATDSVSVNADYDNGTPV